MSNTLTLSGTDGSTLAIGTGGTLGTAAYTASTAYEPAITTLSIAKGGTGKTTANDAFFALGSDILSAGVISAADINAILSQGTTALKLSCTAFKVALRATNSPTATLKVIDVPATVDILTLSVTPNYILLSYNDGITPTWSVATTDTSNGNNIINMGLVLLQDGVIHMIFNIPDIRGNATELAQHKDWVLNPTQRQSGSVI